LRLERKYKSEIALGKSTYIVTFDNLKKSGKEIMYMNKNESWSELKNTNNIGKL